MSTTGDHGTDAIVLITGGSGFLGAHLVRSLLAQGRRVRVLDDESSSGATLDSGVELVRGSVLDEATVTAASQGVGLVFHLAGVVGMRLATQHAARAHQVARGGTQAVLRATAESVPVVLFSSSAVYGLGGDEIMSELTKIERAAPWTYDGDMDGYATGKWEMERLGREAAARGRKILTIRPFNVVGSGQLSSYGMVIPSFVERALVGLPLEIYGDGAQRRCFSNITEFTRLVLALTDNPKSWLPEANVVNVGSDEEITIGELAELVLSITGVKKAPVYRSYADVFPGYVDVPRRVPCTNRLERLAGPMHWARPPTIVHEVVHKIKQLRETQTGGNA